MYVYCIVNKYANFQQSFDATSRVYVWHAHVFKNTIINNNFIEYEKTYTVRVYSITKALTYITIIFTDIEHL